MKKIGINEARKILEERGFFLIRNKNKEMNELYEELRDEIGNEVDYNGCEEIRISYKNRIIRIKDTEAEYEIEDNIDGTITFNNIDEIKEHLWLCYDIKL